MVTIIEDVLRPIQFRAKAAIGEGDKRIRIGKKAVRGIHRNDILKLWTKGDPAVELVLVRSEPYTELCACHYGHIYVDVERTYGGSFRAAFPRRAHVDVIAVHFDDRRPRRRKAPTGPLI